MQKNWHPFRYFIDKHTLAIKELSDLILQMKKLLGNQIEATHWGEKESFSWESTEATLVI